MKFNRSNSNNLDYYYKTQYNQSINSTTNQDNELLASVITGPSLDKLPVQGINAKNQNNKPNSSSQTGGATGTFSDLRKSSDYYQLKKKYIFEQGGLQNDGVRSYALR